MVGADIFIMKNNTLLCTAYYYSTFPVVKITDGLLADNQIKTAKSVFVKFELQKRIVSDGGKSFIADKF